MGFLDSIKASQLGTKAYRLHVTGLQLRQQGKYEESQSKLDQAYKLYGEAYSLGYRKSAPLVGYGILTMQNGEFERARELLLEADRDKGLSKDDRFTLRVNYSICQWKLGKLDKAIETIRNAAHTKMNGTIYGTMGLFLVEKARETGELEEARAFNDQAMEYDDEDASVLDNVAALYLISSDLAKNAGDAEKAASERKLAYENFKKAHEIKPEQVTSAYWLAKMEYENGNVDEARKILTNIMKIPSTALCPVPRSQLEALVKQVG